MALTMANPIELILLICLVIIAAFSVLSWSYLILRLLVISCCQLIIRERLLRQSPQDIESGQQPNNPQPPMARPMLLLPFPALQLSRTALLSKTVLIIYNKNKNTQETTDQNYDVCAICLEKFEDGDQCRVLSGCKHVYQRFCIERWLGETQNCPVCRLSL